MKPTTPNFQPFVRESVAALKSKDYVTFKQQINNLLNLKAKSYLVGLKNQEAKNF